MGASTDFLQSGTFAVLSAVLALLSLYLTFRERRARFKVANPWSDAFASTALRARDVEGRSPAANERGERLRALIDRQPYTEVAETPDGFREVGELSRGEQVAQLVTLKWQLGDSYLLRLGRVTDAVRLLPAELRGDGISVSLCRVKRWRSRSPRFCIVVETDRPAIVAGALSPLAAWFDIGVIVEERRGTFSESGHCLSSGRKGCVGGHITTASGEVAVTCSHVIDDHCGSHIFRSQLAPRTTEPDIALLKVPTPCFGPIENPVAVTAFPMTSDSLIDLAPVRHFPAGSRRGIVQQLTMEAIYEGRLHKFAHALVTLATMDVMGIRWPFWRSQFSRKGDSGSWVVTDDNDWIGVIVGASEIQRSTYVVLAHELVAYLIASGQTPAPAGFSMEGKNR